MMEFFLPRERIRGAASPPPPPPSSSPAAGEDTKVREGSVGAVRSPFQRPQSTADLVVVVVVWTI